MPPTSQRMEQDMTAEDMLREMEAKQSIGQRIASEFTNGASQIMFDDDRVLLATMIDKEIALRAKPAAMDGDVEARIAQIKAREAKATKGPWTRFASDEIYRDGDRLVWTARGRGYGTIAEASGYHPEASFNADFIAASRADVPYLVAQVESLRAAVAKLEHACQQALDAWTLGADPYEQKYYPMAGPTCLVDVLRKALPSPATDAEGKL